MQSRFLYAKYAKICTPHFADAGGAIPLAGRGLPASAIQSVTILYTISNNTQQCHTIYNNIDKI
jgi:hypothetical protein